MLTLENIQKGTQVRFCGFKEETGVQLIIRLSSLGFQKGTHIKVIEKGYLNSTIKVMISGIYVALRNDEARIINVEPCMCHTNQPNNQCI